LRPPDAPGSQSHLSLRGTQGMSPGNPQDGHSSNSSSASGMPGLVSSSSSNGSGHNIRSHGRGRSSRDTTSSDEGDDEDTRTEAAAQQLHETQRAAHAAPQASLTQCHRRCAHMHAPRIAGGPWKQCTNRCREQWNHNRLHNCYGDQWRYFRPVWMCARKQRKQV